MSTPLTFAIPFYAASEELLTHFLRFTIQSVIDQEFQDWKLIVVDDQSPISGVKAFVESFKDPRITYHLNEKNLGQAGNWNQCIRLVDTPYFTLLHADDALKPGYANRMLQAIQENPGSAVIFCQSDFIDETDRKIFSFVDLVKTFLKPGGSFELKGQEGLSLLLKGNFIICPSVLYRKDAVQDLRFLEGGRFKYIPDFYFWSLLLFNGRTLTGIPDNLFLYRRHTASGTHLARSTMRTFEEESDFFNWVREECQKRGWSEAAERARKKRIVKLRTLYYSMHDLAGLRFRAAKDKLKFFSDLS